MYIYLDINLVVSGTLEAMTYFTGNAGITVELQKSIFDTSLTL